MARGRPSKKAHIVEVACGLFSKQGYQSTSIDQVVAAAEVSKPTVYSNFPTKLVLWESALTLLTQRAETEMEAELIKLQQDEDQGFFSGWVSLWELWVSKQERLAVYRVFMGEQHKMEASSYLLLSKFESVMTSVLQNWLKEWDVAQERLFVLKAVTKECLLTPALLGKETQLQSEMKLDDLPLLLSEFIKLKK
ncbi:TetR/AcrR family transcriptional regulator [Marinomonas sp. C2222]|uniref:TetR/AcrR family transcriptional regulator n=1 Tax=Marinomonas sargassi TaxID=2984494 RepID=A0ABT2YQS2_9GAMM|nr:TetR/AcrR family transcriptional regulator [Marinomonas sargassi]MCV2402227.1 TetR/AcrR family transcriptional regulator [Marinomonas sargassi]